ncbi:hypothetical protein [Actinorhabdospora filicis]|nr:hypothetical protein [Actinorhabdospora filicis]
MTIHIQLDAKTMAIILIALLLLSATLGLLRIARRTGRKEPGAR